MRPRVPLEERFWQFVPAHVRVGGSGCWVWIGACECQRGHPIITAGGRNGKRLRARRVAYEIQVGPIPKGHEVIQTCGQILCMRGSHLKALTHSEAMKLILARDGTWQAHGEDNGQAKLTSRQVIQLRHLASRGVKVSRLAEITGMHPSGIRRIVRNESRVAG